jgi:DNA repair protein RadC
MNSSQSKNGITASNLSSKIKDLPLHERPRERMEAFGPEALRDSELIAILLRTGLQGLSAVQIADELVRKFASLQNLAQASISQLIQVKGIGKDKAIALKSAFTLAQRMAREIRRESPALDCPERIADLLREENRFLEVEHFQIVMMNTKNRLIRVEPISKGTLDATLAHPRDVFRPAIMANAASIALVHNHPSGDPTPSEADIRITRDLIRAGKLLKIEILDHIILGTKTDTRHRDFVSLREMGYFYES